MIPYSEGKLKVLESYKGDKKDTISFVKLGGTLTNEEWDRGAPDDLLSIRNENRENSEIPANEAPSYVSLYVEDDPIISPSKTYLFFADYSKEHNRFEMIGYMYGTLEIYDYGTEQAFIIDPVTKEKTSLQTYVIEHK